MGRMGFDHDGTTGRERGSGVTAGHRKREGGSGTTKDGDDSDGAAYTAKIRERSHGRIGAWSMVASDERSVGHDVGEESKLERAAA